MLYWADACSEVAFVVPSKIPNFDASSEQSSFNASSLSSWNSGDPTGRDKRALSLDLEKQASTRRTGHRSNLHPYTNTKIMMVWLESFEDHLTFPISKSAVHPPSCEW